MTIFNSYPDLATLILRIAVGTLFIYHGYPKLTTKRKEGAGWMKNIGMPAVIAPLGGFVEFFGGLALLLGFLTPIIAALSALWMLSTTWFSMSKLKKKYMSGYELDITLLFAALALTLLGGGVYSIDHLLGL